MCKHPMPKGLRFAVLQRTMRRQMDEYVRGTGLTGTQFSVLGALGRLEREGTGEVTQKALEDAAHVTHPTMTELLKKLESKGFITCRPSEVDRRCKAVASAEKARALRQAIGALPRAERGRGRAASPHHRRDAGKCQKNERRTGFRPVRERM